MKASTRAIALSLLCIYATAGISITSFSTEIYGPKTSNMLIHIFNTSEAEFSAFESSTGAEAIDIIDSPLSQYWIDRWMTNPNIRLYTYDTLDTFEFDINNQRWPTGVTEPRTLDPSTSTYKHYFGANEPWDSKAKEFRKAIAYLTDKNRYITEILNGYGYRIDTPVPLPALAGYTDYADLRNKGLIYDYNPATAATILNDAGFIQGTTSNPYYDPATSGSAEYLRTDPRYGGDLQPLVFYIRNDDPLRLAAGQKLSAQMRKAGIQVSAVEASKSTCYNNVMALYDYHLYTGGRSLDANIDFLYDLYHSGQYWGGTATSYYDGTGWSTNYAGLCSSDYDSWAMKTKYGLTLADVKNGALKAQEIHAAMIATIPVWTPGPSVKAYKTGWAHTACMTGQGKDNYWSFLNMTNADGSPLNPADNEIDWGFSGTFSGPNVVTTTGKSDLKLLGLIYDSLLGTNPFSFDEDFGWLAEHWETGTWATGKSYVLFRLRPSMTFHNGDPVTPEDVKFSLEFMRACGPGVASNYNDVDAIDHVATQTDEPTLGNTEVKVYFNVESYWVSRLAGLQRILNRNVWMMADNNLGWGYARGMTDWNLFTNRMMVRDYQPWQYDGDGDGILDLIEDGTGAWKFVGYAPSGPVSAATSASLSANTNFYLSQQYIANYLVYAFHVLGDVNEDGMINNADVEIVERAMGTNKWDYPWGTGWDEYNPNADIVTSFWDMATGTPSYGDGYINYLDLGKVGVNAGKAADGGPSPYPPTANFLPSSGRWFYVNAPVTFDASTLSKPGFDGDDTCPITEYKWDFGDGTPPQTYTNPLTTHLYTAHGIYNVKLTVYAPEIAPYADFQYVEHDSEIHAITLVDPAPAGSLLIHVFNSEAAELEAFQSATGADAIDFIDSPLPKSKVDLWQTAPYKDYINLTSYGELGVYEVDINNQRWPTGVTEPRTLDSRTGTYKHYFGTNEPWDSKAVEFRKAIAYLSNKDKWITDILKGYGHRLDTMVPIGTLAGYTDYIGLRDLGYIYDYSPVKAAQVLDAAGFTQGATANPYYDSATPGSAQYLRTDPRYGGDLQPLVFYIRSDDPLRRDIGLDLTAELRKAGIQVNAIVTGKTVCYNYVMVLYDYHLYTGSCNVGTDVPVSLWGIQHSAQYWGGTTTSYYGGTGWSPNYAGLCDTVLDGYLDTGKSSGSFETAKTACLQAQERAAQLASVIPAFDLAAVKAFKNGWQFVTNSRGYGPDNRWTFLQCVNILMNSPNNPYDEEIDWGFESPIESLNPITTDWPSDLKIIDLIYDSMLTQNPYDLSMEYGVAAEGWSFDPETQTARFTLRPGNTFHDGSPVTPEDVKFSIEFTKACGPGVAADYDQVESIQWVHTQVDDPSLGSRDVKIQFSSASYWAIHFAGFRRIYNSNVWMRASSNLGWGYTRGMADFNLFTNRMMVRDYQPWLYDGDADGIVDFAEDGSGPWKFVSYAPSGPISAATSVSFSAFSSYILPQSAISSYLAWAFQMIGDVNGDRHIDALDGQAIARALGTNSNMLPWGIGWDQYNQAADINTGKWDMINQVPLTHGDGQVNYLDLGKWGLNYGASP